MTTQNNSLLSLQFHQMINIMRLSCFPISDFIKLKLFKKLVKEIFIGVDHYHMIETLDVDGAVYNRRCIFYMQYHDCEGIKCLDNVMFYIKFIESLLESKDFKLFLFTFDKFLEQTQVKETFLGVRKAILEKLLPLVCSCNPKEYGFDLFLNYFVYQQSDFYKKYNPFFQDGGVVGKYKFFVVKYGDHTQSETCISTHLKRVRAEREERAAKSLSDLLVFCTNKSNEALKLRSELVKFLNL